MNTTTDKTLAVSGLSNFNVTITAEAEQQKADALALSKTIAVVTNERQMSDAVVCAGLLKGLLKSCETVREEIKAPVLAAGRMIDDIAKLYAGNLKAEVTRIEGMMSTWQAQENLRLSCLLAEQEHANRIAAEAADAERKAFLQIIATASDEQQKEVMQRAADEAAERNAEAARARQTAVLAIPQAKAEGARVREQKDYRVLNISEVYASRPDLCELTIKRAITLAAVSIPGANIPGLEIFDTTKVQAKAI